MTVLPIVTGADTPVLRSKTQRVGKPTKEILALLRDMEETTRNADGLGLAAPQVNTSVRVCVARINGRLTPLIDPDITWRSDKMELAEEGCLSLPGIWMSVPRAQGIVLRYVDGRGQKQERRLEGIDARVVQHEVDHLDGILIVDYRAPGVEVPRTRKADVVG